MAVYFVTMESTAGFGCLAGDRIIAPDAKTAKAIGEVRFQDETIAPDESEQDREWLNLMFENRRPRIAAGYVMKARKSR